MKILLHRKSEESRSMISICQQGCFKGRSAKETVIMGSSVMRLKKIHGNIKAYFFRTFIPLKKVFYTSLMPHSNFLH